MALSYRLIKFYDLVINRKAKGDYVDGEWVEGAITPFTIKAKVQPLTFTEVMILSEAERNKSWVKVYIQADPSLTTPVLRSAQQGTGGWDADELTWQGFTYEVMKDMNYDKSILQFTNVLAARKEVTPN